MTLIVKVELPLLSTTLGLLLQCSDEKAVKSHERNIHQPEGLMTLHMRRG